MDELISRLVENVGLDAATAERVVGIILNMFQSNASGDSLSELMAAFPGAEGLMSQVSDGGAGASESAGGGLGGLISGALGAMGGDSGGLMETVGKLQAEGLSMDQAKSAGSEILGFAREKAGDDAVNNVLESIPALKNLL